MERQKRSSGHRRVREATAARYTVEASPTELIGVLLDSDVVIEVLRGRKAIVAALSALEARGVPTFTCGVVVASAAATTGLRLWTLNRRRYPMRDVRFVDA